MLTPEEILELAIYNLIAPSKEEQDKIRKEIEGLTKEQLLEKIRALSMKIIESQKALGEMKIIVNQD